MDISLWQTVITGLKGVHPRKSWLYYHLSHEWQSEVTYELDQSVSTAYCQSPSGEEQNSKIKRGQWQLSKTYQSQKNM